jgi:hypothetical protein
MGPRIIYDAPVQNIIRLDDRTDKPDGKVLIVSNEILCLHRISGW